MHYNYNSILRCSKSKCNESENKVHDLNEYDEEKEILAKVKSESWKEALQDRIEKIKKEVG